MTDRIIIIDGVQYHPDRPTSSALRKRISSPPSQGRIATWLHCRQMLKSSEKNSPCTIIRAERVIQKK